MTAKSYRPIRVGRELKAKGAGVVDGRDALGVTAVLRRRRVYDRLIIVGDTSSGVIERKAKSSEVVNREDVLGGDYLKKST